MKTTEHNQLLHSHLAEFALAQCRLMESDKLRDSEGDCIQDKSFDAAFQRLLNHNRDYKLIFFCYQVDYPEVEASLRRYESEHLRISILRYEEYLDGIMKDRRGNILYRQEDQYPCTLENRVIAVGGDSSRGKLSRAELAEYAYAYCSLLEAGKICYASGYRKKESISSATTFKNMLAPEPDHNNGVTHDNNTIFCYDEDYAEIEASLRKYEREYFPIRIFIIYTDFQTGEFQKDKEGYLLYHSRDCDNEPYPWKMSLKGFRQCRAPDPYCIKNPCTPKIEGGKNVT